MEHRVNSKDRHIESVKDLIRMLIQNHQLRMRCFESLPAVAFDGGQEQKNQILRDFAEGHEDMVAEARKAGLVDKEEGPTFRS